MKKLLTMAAIAAMSFGAQAAVTWSMDIRECEVGKILEGTVPTTLTVSLWDTAGGGYRQVYSQKNIDFGQLTDSSGYISDYKGQSRFDIVKYIQNGYDGAQASFTDSKGTEGTLTVSMDDQYGTMAQWSVVLTDEYTVFPAGATATDYAKNLVAVFTTGDESYMLGGSTAPDGSTLLTQGNLSDIKSVDISSWNNVPEPTSGLLMLLGMAGLALKRKMVVG